MSWDHGSAEVDALVVAGELQKVPPDQPAAERRLDDAERHLGSAEAIMTSDPNGAFSMAYDATRKAMASLLETQGLRATSRGGHIAVRDATQAQFGAFPGGEVLVPFDRLRRRRNQIEYPDDEATADLDEVADAIARAREIVEYARTLMPHLPRFS